MTSLVLRKLQSRRMELSLERAIFFCDPHRLWQHATNERANGLTRGTSPTAWASTPSFKPS